MDTRPFLPPREGPGDKTKGYGINIGVQSFVNHALNTVP